MKRKVKISRDAIVFFCVELRNDPPPLATLGTAYDSYRQASPALLLEWCGYRKDYPRLTWGQGDITERFNDELGLELRRLIRLYGKKQPLIELV